MNAAPPRLRPAPFPITWFAGAVLAAAALGAGAMVYFFDPATHGFYPVCRFHQLTGWNCPGCGGTRAVAALLHGNLRLAWRDNALLTLAPAAFGLRLGWLGVARWRGYPARPLIPAQGVWLFAVVAVVFAVVRNLPACACLSPA